MSIQSTASSVLKTLSFGSLIAASLLVAPHPVYAQAAAAEAPVRDAAVLKRLAEVGAYLRAPKHFAVTADAVIDEVLLSGQKLQFTSTFDYQVSSPDKLRATVRSDRKHRDYYFDGKTLTQVAPRNGYYASVPMPGTIGEGMIAVSQRFDIEIPLSDLFLWGTPRGGLDDVSSALFVGPAQIAQRAARHPGDEQEQHRDERRLQRDGGRLQHHSTSKRADTVPTSSRSPDRSTVRRLARAPLICTPLVEPRSTTDTMPPRRCSLQ